MHRLLLVLALFSVTVCGLPTSVRVGDWVANCIGVSAEDCSGIAGLFVNNLAWSGEAIRSASGGRVSVAPLPACPADLESWADPSACWRAWAPLGSGRACMVIARQNGTVDAGSRFGQAGGDEYTGRFGAPAPGTQPCG